jgi:hypothetical protein
MADPSPGYRIGVPRVPESTLDDLESRSQDVVGLWGRRAFLTVLLGVVVAGVVGLLGVHSTVVESEQDGWTLRLEYADTARAGLDVPFTATVSRQGGLSEQVTLALTGDYLDIYESQAFHPEPSESSRDGETLYLTFDSPASGDTLTVSYDAYIQPAAQRGRAGTLAVVSDGRRVAVVELRTRVLP